MLPRLVATVAPILLERQWLLFQPPDGERFWISDNPVALHDKRTLRRTEIWDSPCLGSEVYLPLAPMLMLGVWCPTRGEMVKNGFDATSSQLKRMDHWPTPSTIGDAIEVEHRRSQLQQASSELGTIWNSVTKGTAAPCTSKDVMSVAAERR